MIVKNQKELEILRAGGKILSDTLKILAQASLPGVTTEYLNKLAQELILKAGAEAAFFNYQPSWASSPFPAILCVCINEEIVHAIPSSRQLKNGDILSLDLGVKYQGLFTDAAITFPIGEISKEAKKLLAVTNQALDLAIQEMKVGKRLGDIGFVIQKHIESNNFKVIKNLTGHGVGRALHEPPEVLNYGKPGKGVELVEGMVLALEPMASISVEEISVGKDGWTISTADKSLSAHFEKTIMVTKTGAEVLTKF